MNGQGYNSLGNNFQSSMSSLFNGDGSETYDFSMLDEYYQQEFTMMMQNLMYRGKINFPIFLFGVFWLLYKSMWLPALIVFVISFFTVGIVHLYYGLF